MSNTADEGSSSQSLAKDLSGTDTECPFPSAHDKVLEAHYFIHQMLGNYHNPGPFRYSLSAFLQAARSITYVLQAELPDEPDPKRWYQQKREELARDSDLKLINTLRVEVVHRKSLIPASSMWMGYFKYKEKRFGFGQYIGPMISSFRALLLARRHLQMYVTPHRIWIGEELGVHRVWSLPELSGREIVSFCISVWEKLASVVSRAHEKVGAEFSPVAECKHGSENYGRLLESDVFSEVMEPWADSPLATVLPRGEELPLLAEPRDDGEKLHTVKKGVGIRGWIGRPSSWWRGPYASMLVYSIGRKIIYENTAVFFDRSKVKVTKGRKSFDWEKNRKRPTTKKK